MFKGTRRCPSCIPEELKDEYFKYIRDKLKYQNLYPVLHKIIQSYLKNGEQNGEKQTQKTE